MASNRNENDDTDKRRAAPADDEASRVFELEQRHLSATYATLEAMEGELAARIERRDEQAARELADMAEQVTRDTSAGAGFDAIVELDDLGDVVGWENQANDADVLELRRIRQLLRRPYFAKVSLRMRPDAAPRDVYLGTTGASDPDGHRMVIDWRSPVAEVYYSQATGPTSYEANEREIPCELVCRRQFDIERDRLRAWFDTTVAIEDPLLIAALSRARTNRMRDVTATIQREQNEVVRHPDVPVLLVNGIAGSGKTSVLMQRIAYLLYRDRAHFTSRQVLILTPNPVFERYIADVLPDMGEANPTITTWAGFVASLGLADHGTGSDVSAERLRELERQVGGMHGRDLEARDLAPIAVHGRTLLTVTQVQNAVWKRGDVELGPRLFAGVCEALLDRLGERLSRLAGSDEIAEELAALDAEDQVRICGHAIDADDHDAMAANVARYVEAAYGEPARKAIERGAWLRLERIGMRLGGVRSISALELVYLSTLLTGNTMREMRHVTIDEVQDYTEAQLMVLARLFDRAHFLLLGDESQSIRDRTVTPDGLRRAFAGVRGEHDEVDLLTSYRSSPEITALFTSLLPADRRGQVRSVRPSGEMPAVRAFSDDAEGRAGWWQSLCDAVAAAAERTRDGSLAAVVTQDGDEARLLVRRLAKEEGPAAQVRLVTEKAPLPERGIVAIGLPLAKGLEFDEVIVPDADAGHYPDTPLARRRLYTALSRATQRLTVLSCGPLTPLLGAEAQEGRLR